MQLTNCRQVTQIIHAEDDDDDGKEAQAGEDAMGMKWDRMGWDGMGWGGMERNGRPLQDRQHCMNYFILSPHFPPAHFCDSDRQKGTPCCKGKC